MGKRKKPSQVYVPNPTPATAPSQTPDSVAAQAGLQQQLMEMRKQYETQLASMGDTYKANSTNSNSVLAELQSALQRQQQTSLATSDELAKAREASSVQAGLLKAQKDAAEAQYGQTRQSSLDQTTSLFGRLQRRTKERATVY